jgi:hypothetical protein
MNTVYLFDGALRTASAGTSPIARKTTKHVANNLNEFAGFMAAPLGPVSMTY